jgi:hypothetical protein
VDIFGLISYVLLAPFVASSTLFYNYKATKLSLSLSLSLSHTHTEANDTFIQKNWLILKSIPISVSADRFLLFQLFIPLQTQFPILSRLYETYDEIPAFQDAMPEKQPDAPLTSTS